MTGKLHKAMVAALLSVAIGVILWFGLQLAVMLLGDRYIYNIESPAQIINVNEERAVIRLVRYSLWEMEAHCSQELYCGFVFPISEEYDCPVEFDYTTRDHNVSFLLSLPIVTPENREFIPEDGCHYVGRVNYTTPLGIQSSHTWVTEKFHPQPQ